MTPEEWELYAEVCKDRDFLCWQQCMELYGDDGIEAAAEAGYWWHHRSLLLGFRFIQRVYKTQYNVMYVHINPPYQNWEINDEIARRTAARHGQHSAIPRGR